MKMILKLFHGDRNRQAFYDAIEKLAAVASLEYSPQTGVRPQSPYREKIEELENKLREYERSSYPDLFNSQHP